MKNKALISSWINKIMRVPPWIVLILCLLFTGIAVKTSYDFEQKAQSSRFERILTILTGAVETRLRIYTNTLRAAQGLFLVDHKISTQDFKRFIHNFKLQERHPGIQGVGLAMKMSPFEVKSQKFISVWPLNQNDNEDIFPIIAIEPNDWRNQRALGFNMFTESVRRAAMEKARDSGELSATPKITLVQEVEEDRQSGFIIFAPLYKTNRPLQTLLERRRALIGYVYSPFRAKDLFQKISEEYLDSHPLIRLQIFDGENPHLENLLFSSLNDSKNKEIRSSQRTMAKTVEVYNQKWLIKLSAMEGFEVPLYNSSPFLVGSIGALISVIVFFLLTKMRKDSQAKSQFLASVSHEIRTPLGIIMGFADLASSHPRLPEEIKTYLVRIKRNCEHILSLVGDVLDISKIETNKFEIEKSLIDLPTLLEEIIQSLKVRASEKKLEIRWSKKYPIPQHINTDPTKLRQILSNLIINAIKFTDHGHITVTPKVLKQDDAKKIMLLEFLISDTGEGISLADQKKIFIPFEKTKTSSLQRGSGLGLSISRELAQILGGSLELVHSEVGRGSLFSVKIFVDDYTEVWTPPLFRPENPPSLNNH